MLASRYRFHGHGSLNFLYKNGTAVRSHYMVIKYIKNPRRNHSRVSVVISKKVHKSAVGRNRIRRRVYEIMRPELTTFTSNYDITCIVVSGETLALSPQALQQTIHSLLAQTPVYQPL